MANEDGSLQLVFNGEIYNFRELRDRLAARGHRFRSHTDSEVILHAYEEYGQDAVNRLRGMFAFAVWDRGKRELFLARDRIGIKPLYYHLSGDRFIFASEIKAILEDPKVPRRMNPQALYDYLGFEFVAAPATLFEKIHKLPAGHCMTVRDGKVRVRAYWDLTFKRPEQNDSFADAAAKTQQLLDDAVQRHLISDVPLGVFLSGGIDSSALVAMMRRHISGPLRTFSIGYSDKSYSELEYARQVAECFGTDHHVLMLDDITLQDVEKAVWHLDEPMTDLSSIPLMLACRKAREQITVCLSGEGGDEVFAGYDRFKASRINRFYRRVPRRLREDLIHRLIRRLPDQPSKKGALNMLKRLVEGSALPPDGRHLRWQYFSNERQDRLLYRDSLREQIEMDPFRQIRETMAGCDAGDEVNREIYLDTRFMMSDSVLMKVDKMSMASSLEVRVPLLDHGFVEYAATLPGNWKLKGLRTKHVLRAALKGVLPENIVNRGKQGYSLPVKHLLRNQLKKTMIEVLNESPVIKETMNVDYVNRLIEEHLSARQNHNHVLWGLLNVALWHNRFIRRNRG